MRHVLPDLLSYVPATVVDGLGERPLAPGERDCFAAVVLFADLAGSTAVGEVLARHGSIGAEALSGLLNAYISPVVAAVHAHGGQVAKFTGDGLLALWPRPSEGLADTVRRAAQCGAAIQATVAQLARAETTALGATPMTMRIAIGCGEVTLTLVATEADHLEPLFAGTAVRETAAACSAGEPGSVFVTAAAHRLLDGLHDANASESALPRRVEIVAAPETRSTVRGRKAPAELGDALRRLVPALVAESLAVGQADWLGELRRISALFVNVATSPGAEAPAALRAATIIQAALERYGGALARIGVEEKGLVFLAVFGVAARTHEDDPARAVGAALEIHQCLAATAVQGRLGVATGRAYCGALGNPDAREYTVVGDVVNVAARLMQAAAGGVLCDSETRRLVAERFAFAELPAIIAKGRTQPVIPFQPMGPRNPEPLRARPMIGRAVELERLVDLLGQVAASGNSHTVIIEGDPGIGKSTLVAALASAVAPLPVRVIVGVGTPFQAGVPFHVWAAILRSLVAIVPTSEGEQIVWRDDAAAALEPVAGEGDAAWWHARRPLLNYILGASADGLAWEGEGLSVEADELVLRILAAAASRSPLLLVLEDAHWFDSSSWLLARLATERLAATMTVVVTRPLPDDLPPDVRQLLARSDVERIIVGPLATDEAQALARRSFGVGGLADPLVDLVLARTHGHPLFIDELARSLGGSAAGVFAGADAAERLAGGPWAAELPPTLEGVVAARIASLPPAQQLVLKVGSVLGPSFSLATLQAVFPMPVTAAAIEGDTAALCVAGLLQAGGAAGEFEFRHAIMRDAAYATTLYAQRRVLHEAVARWMESHADPAVPATIARLAYHWTEAARREPALVPKAIDYLERAGEMAASRYAHRETVRFLSQAAAFAESSASAASVSVLRRLRWQRRLGEACFGLGQLDRARGYLCHALDLSPVGRPLTRWATVFDLAGGVAAQVVRRSVPRRVDAARGDGLDADQREILVEAANAYNFLQIIAFIEMDRLAAVQAAVRAVNLAESAGPSRPFVYALGGVGLLAGAVSRSAAERYFDLALGTVAELGDRAAEIAPWFARGYMHMRSGEWERAENSFARAQRIAEECGDRRFWEMCEMQRGSVHFSRGEFSRCLARYEAAEASARRRGDVDAQALATVGQVTALAHLGHTELGLRRLGELNLWLGHDFAALRDMGIKINALGVRALLLWRSGERAEALDAARQAARRIARAPVLAHYALPGYASIAEVALRAAQDGSRDRWLIKVACRGLLRFRIAFPFARAQAQLWRGVRAALRGRSRRAVRLWRDGLKVAEELGMAHESGLLRLELARRGEPSKRDENRARAIDILDSAGAAFDAARARELDLRP